MARLGNERGQTILMYTLSLTAMFGLISLVVDVGWMYFREQAAQSAAEAAALAGASAAKQSSGGTPTCDSSNVVCQAATACPSAIPNPPTNNIHNGCLYAKENGFQVTAGGRQSVMLASNTTSPVSGVNVAYWVTATVSETVPQTFAAVLGSRFGTVSARATAAVLPNGGGGCVYVLSPSGTSVTNSGNGQLQTGCGVYIDSNSNSAATLSGNAKIVATGDRKSVV